MSDIKEDVPEEVVTEEVVVENVDEVKDEGETVDNAEGSVGEAAEGEEGTPEGENVEGGDEAKPEDVVVLTENGEEIVQKNDIDQRSVCVKNVDYGSAPEDLKEHFATCGAINRVTIICDKFTGHPKGFAYVEFAETESVESAKLLNDSLFRGRQIQVLPKRTNIPFRGRASRRPRGRFFSRGPRIFSGRGRYNRGGFRYRPY